MPPLASVARQDAPEHRELSRTAMVITCEHGGNRIPLPYRALFTPHRALLATHRGYDDGALRMARALSAALGAPLLAATVSRLLVDLNRSIGHPQLHFEPVKRLPASQRQEILRHHYQPYRSQVERLVSEAIAAHGRVIHLSCHSFTPVLHGVARKADIGLLYDPARAGEKALCAQWKRALEAQTLEARTLEAQTLAAHAAPLVVRRNYPYAGRNDGLTAWLRKRHPPEAYVGIELELNQKHITRSPGQWAALRGAVIDTLQDVLRGEQRGELLAATDPAAGSALGGKSSHASAPIESCGAAFEPAQRTTGVST